MVPAMQWFWWLIGRVLPSEPIVPVLLMVIAGTVSIGCASGAVGTLTNRSAGWSTAVILALHPAHAAWSSSAYNVILPHLFGCLALYAVARCVVRAGSPGAWGMVAAGAIALSVAVAAPQVGSQPQSGAASQPQEGAASQPQEGAASQPHEGAVSQQPRPPWPSILSNNPPPKLWPERPTLSTRAPRKMFHFIELRPPYIN